MGKNVPAMTLIELLFALGIIVAAFGVGTIGLIRFRSIAQVNRANSDLISLIRSSQNQARNAVISSIKNQNTGSTVDSVPDLHAIFFEEDNYSTYYCDLVSQNYSCNLQEETLKAADLSQIEITSSCVGVGFLKSGDIVSLTLTGGYNTLGTCEINIKHSVTNVEKNITIDLSTNNISLDS